MTETFPITQRRIVPARLFPASTIAQALADVENAKDPSYVAQYMPEVIDARIADPDKDSPIWQNYISTPSIRATGKTKQGKAVVAYAHIPHLYSTAESISKAIESGQLRNGALPLTPQEFQRILDLEGNKRVFVIDYNTLRDSTRGVVSIAKAAKHPQTAPFLGGEEKVEPYIDAHEKVYGSKIGVWHSDDLQTDGVAVARPLYVGYGCINGLNGNLHFDGGGRFLGVSAGEASTRKIFPSMEQLEQIIQSYVAEVNYSELRERISALYK